jgi:hypothetical protein
MQNAGAQTLVTSYTSSVGIQLQTKGQTALPPANSENLPVTAGSLISPASPADFPVILRAYKSPFSVSQHIFTFHRHNLRKFKLYWQISLVASRFWL